MRALTQQELDLVSGGCASGSSRQKRSSHRRGCYSAAKSSCEPVESCEPVVSCDPKPLCTPAAETPAAPVLEEIFL